MSDCCGGRRAALKARLRAQAQAQAPAQAPAAHEEPPPRRLCYRSGIALAVAGPVTGRPYVFRAGRLPTEVDPDDALALLETGRYDEVA